MIAPAFNRIFTVYIICTLSTTGFGQRKINQNYMYLALPVLDKQKNVIHLKSTKYPCPWELRKQKFLNFHFFLPVKWTKKIKIDRQTDGQTQTGLKRSTE